MSEDPKIKKLVEEFFVLVNKADQKFVRKAIEAQKITKSEFDKLRTTKDVKARIKAFGDAIAEQYKLDEKASDVISESTRDLLEFIMKNNSGVREFIPTCSLPLEPGDITFDDIAGNEDVKEDIRMNYIYPFRYPGLFKNKSKGILFYGPPGTGKCLAPDEKVVMFDGTLKEARFIVIGDKLMGDDSTPRNVLSTCSGEDNMFRIIPTEGEPFIVNSPHILTLVSCKPSVKKCSNEGIYKVLWMKNGKLLSRSFTGLTDDIRLKAEEFCFSVGDKPDVIDIPLNEYICKSELWKSQYKGFRTEVEWESQVVPFDPYVLGMWLGDGSSCYSDNSFKTFLQKSNLIKNKCIPLVYKANDRTVRLEILAGLIDSNGYLNCDCYEIVQKSKVLTDDIAFVARSLGFYTSINEYKKTRTNGKNELVTETYHKVIISNNGAEVIPVRLEKKKAGIRCQVKDANHFGFEIEPLDIGEYCGFALDGNSRFLLKDFTVTHNTLMARAATAAIPGAAFFAPTSGELRGKYEGETEKNIAKLFACAQQILEEKNSTYKVSIIFIDEFDSLAGASRSEDPGMQRSVNSLLQAMDGIQAMPDVSVIAATNFPWKIDGAIRRRFSAEIFIDLPDKEAREFLIRQSIAKNFLAPWKSKSDYISDASKFKDTIFDDIELYGHALCSVKETKVISGYFGGSTKEKTKKVMLVNADFISQDEGILKKTGPNDDAKNLLQKIKDNGINYTDLNLQDVDYDNLKFGYSGSDVDKLMVTCIQFASSRALRSGYIPLRDSGENDDENEKEYYRAVPLKDKDAEYVLFSWLNKERKRPLKVMTDNQAARALNFSFCQMDVEKGLDKYPSTIISKKYVDMILYKYRGIIPDEE